MINDVLFIIIACWLKTVHVSQNFLFNDWDSPLSIKLFNKKVGFVVFFVYLVDLTKCKLYQDYTNNIPRLNIKSKKNFLCNTV